MIFHYHQALLAGLTLAMPFMVCMAQANDGAPANSEAANLESVKSSTTANYVVAGYARFTVITPECIRMEYQPDGKFIDAPSMFAVGRGIADQNAKVDFRDKTFVIDTGRMKLEFTPNGKPFSAENLKVTIKKSIQIAEKNLGRDAQATGKLGQNAQATSKAEQEKGEIVWTPDSRQTANLGGTIPTLDQVKGPVPLHDGILSRDGWYLIDDSQGFLLANDWVTPRPADSGTDWYLFGYGQDYAGAFRAFTTIGGAVPMPRKCVLGSWYSRWWKYTTEDYKQIVREYAKHDFPLDIIVMDMEWHRKGWTGWSWNYDLLPDPPALLRWFHEQGLAVTLNVHPADGVLPHETMYKDFMRYMGVDPATSQTIPFDAGDPKYMDAYFRFTHHPREAEGVDFWWLDWQQYPDVKSMPGLRNLAWLNTLYFENSMRAGKRGLQFSRWGGWGDHRHPIHFSGDADTGWTMLGFEVPFTSTAANEGAYFWSHDIGGHFGDRNEEPFTRWVQLASVTAAMRLHSSIIKYLDRRPWLWPDWATESMRRSFHLRSRLMPYIYSAVRQTNETGLPLTRPMYVQWPGVEDAFAAPQEYMFGSDFLAAPIAAAGSGPVRVAALAVWFPEGEWRNFFTGEAFTGPQWRVVCADINEFPLFVRAGAPIPMQPYSARPTTAKLDRLVVQLWPGAEGKRHSFTLYEDDGFSRDYEKGGLAKTELTSLRKGGVLEVGISPAKGEFKGQPSERAYEIVVGGMERPKSVKVDGKPVADSEWSEAERTITVRVPSRSIRKALAVTVEAQITDPAYFASRYLKRRLNGIVRGVWEAEQEEPTLESALALASEKAPELLPGLAALAGLATVENETHYPQPGVLRRMIRNADSTVISPEGIALVWQRTLSPSNGVAPLEERVAVPKLSGMIPFEPPAWKRQDLAFLQSATDDRTLTFRAGGQEYAIHKSLGQMHGQIGQWLLNGPFPFDRATSISEQCYEPEKMPVKALAALTPKSGGWAPWHADADGVVDLGKAIGGENRIAYAVTTIDFDTPRDAILGFRSDDGIEVWLNGKKIHSRHVLRGMNHDWEEVPVAFAKGKNVLLVKVSQAEYDWAFCVTARQK